jgi:general secretion pathway protein G
MFSTYRRLKRQRDAGEINGFTLIEILIVIVVLGILAAVVIYALGGITGKSAIAACQADGATVSTAIADFNSQNPGSTATIATLLSGTTANGTNPYLQSWPSNGSHYVYTMASGALQINVGTGPTYDNALTTGIAGAYTGPASCTNVQ